VGLIAFFRRRESCNGTGSSGRRSLYIEKLLKRILIFLGLNFLYQNTPKTSSLMVKKLELFAVDFSADEVNVSNIKLFLDVPISECCPSRDASVVVPDLAAPKPKIKF
jgi:hypothetical protein